MERVKVSVAGECYTHRQLEGLREIYNELENLSNTVEVTSDFSLIRGTDLADEDNCCEIVTDLVLSGIEKSEVCVVMAPSIEEGGFCSLGWILGFCWSQGVQVVIMEITEDVGILHPLANRPIQAHLTSLEELSTYNFTEMPYVPAQKKVN